MPSKSEFACKCGCGNNLITDDVVTLCSDIKNELGEAISINSGYRCKTHNAAVGGVSNSQHVKGNAADISCSNLPKLKKLCKRMWSANKVGGLGLYATFVHVDTGSHRTWSR